MRIKELIVVEGKDDISAVKHAVDAEVIATGGYGFGKELINMLREAVSRTGVIIFVDPDSAGNQIRRRLNRQVPGCKNAYLSQEEGRKGKNIGIENAAPEAIRAALRLGTQSSSLSSSSFILQDLWQYALAGQPGAEIRRKKVGKLLGIGETNTKQFLNRLNHQGITQEQLLDAIETLMRED